MGAGASALGEKIDCDRAMNLAGRYGFTAEMFETMQSDGTITIKQLIGCVKKHSELQAFDKNRDGVIDKSEMNGIVNALKSEEEQNNKAAGGSNGEAVSPDAPANIKTVVTGTIKQEDYRLTYTPMSELGSGMSGTVFSVQHKGTGSTYACKSVRKKGMRDVDLAALRGEIALLSQLDHPNIVKIIEAFEDPKYITMIMELCTGGELYDSLITAEFYSEKVARQLFRQIARAILYCHNQTVCHRDLKLENFVFDSKTPIKTGDEVLKLIDFGLSRRYSSLKRMSTVVGTPYYIAPEVIKAEKYGLQCDIWSLGIILFMLLTGIPPVSGDTDAELLMNVRNGELSLENQWTPDWATMPEAFDLIKKMLTVDPAKRINIKDIMAHAWLAQDSSQTKEHVLDLKIVEGMRRFSKMDPLQRIASKIVAVTLSTNEIEALRSAFMQIDRDNSGIISVEEFSKAMGSSMGESQDIKNLFQKIDMDGTGTISFVLPSIFFLLFFPES
eukprot:INCI1871.2.p1 GENE.INCI1871.2~~INCI1871.2.p1  ORF type:complete len:500 (-),score=99.45 INCI1871.2:501-2000(-)